MTKTAEDKEQAIMKATAESTATAINIQYIQKDISEIKTGIKEMSQSFVTQTEFTPIKNILFGLVATVLIAFVGSIINIIIKK